MTITRRQALSGLLAAGVLAGCSKADHSYVGGDVVFDLPPRAQTMPAPKLTRIGDLKVSGTATVTGDLLLDGDANRRVVTVTDLATGRQLWTAKDDVWDAQLPEGESRRGELVLTHAETPLLVTTTYVNPCPGNASLCHESQTDRTDGRNVLAIDARTRKVLWKTAAVPSVPRTEPSADQWKNARVQIWGGTDDVVIVALKLSDGVRTVALDAATGKARWQRDGLSPGYLGAGLLVCGVQWGELRAPIGLTSFKVVDVRTGKDVAISGRPSTDGRVMVPLSSFLPQDVLGLVESGTSGRAWALDLRARRMVPGPRQSTIGRAADGKVLCVTVTSTYQDAARRTELITRVEGEQMASIARVGATDNAQRVVGVLDGTIWLSDSSTKTTVVDRAGKTLVETSGQPTDLRRPVSIVGGYLYRVS